jgi:hypothetical protein
MRRALRAKAQRRRHDIDSAVIGSGFALGLVVLAQQAVDATSFAVGLGLLGSATIVLLATLYWSR